MGVGSNRFFKPRQQRPFLQLEDLLPVDAQEQMIIDPPRPRRKPVEDDQPVMPQATIDGQPADQNTLIAQEDAIDEVTPFDKPSKAKLAIAQSMMQRGEENSPQGAGWVGALDRALSATGGAYFAKEAEREQQDLQRKQGEAIANSLSGETDDAFARYVRAVAQTDPARAQAMIEKKMIADAAARNRQPLTRNREDNGIIIQEQSVDNGKTWTEFGRGPKFRPDNGSGGTDDTPRGYEWVVNPETGQRELKYIKGGPGDPATKPANEIQSASGAFGERMADTFGVLQKPHLIKALMDPRNKAFAMVPVLGNYPMDPAYRLAAQHVRNFINAQLRRESGAAISEGEFHNAYQQYIPQPGDDAVTIKAKERNRQMAIYNMFFNAGPKYEDKTMRWKPVDLGSERGPGAAPAAPPPAGAKPAPAAAAPAKAAIRDGHQRPNPKDPSGKTILIYNAAKGRYFPAPNPQAPR